MDERTMRKRWENALAGMRSVTDRARELERELEDARGRIAELETEKAELQKQAIGIPLAREDVEEAFARMRKLEAEARMADKRIAELEGDYVPDPMPCGGAPQGWVFHGDDGIDTCQFGSERDEDELECGCGKQRTGWWEPLWGTPSEQWERVGPPEPAEQPPETCPCEGDSDEPGPHIADCRFADPGYDPADEGDSGPVGPECFGGSDF